MSSAPLHRQERERLEALRQYRILDTSPERGFDDITYLASALCATPIAVVTFIDKDRQWFKSRIGLTVPQTARSISICAYTILQHSIMVVPDLTSDQRFADNPMVTGTPDLRFYAGVPVFSRHGFPLGTVAVMDRTTRTLTVGQEESLRAISRLASSMLELRRVNGELIAAQDAMNLYSEILPVCSSCRKVKSEDGEWVILEHYVKDHLHDTSQGICPDCANRLYPDYIRS